MCTWWVKGLFDPPTMRANSTLHLTKPPETSRERKRDSICVRACFVLESARVTIWRQGVCARVRMCVPVADVTMKSPPSTGHVTSHEVVGVTRLCTASPWRVVAVGLLKIQPNAYQSAAVLDLQVLPVCES